MYSHNTCALNQSEREIFWNKFFIYWKMFLCVLYPISGALIMGTPSGWWLHLIHCPPPFPGGSHCWPSAWVHVCEGPGKGCMFVMSKSCQLKIHKIPQKVYVTRSAETTWGLNYFVHQNTQISHSFILLDWKMLPLVWTPSPLIQSTIGGTPLPIGLKNCWKILLIKDWSKLKSWQEVH